MRGKSKFRNSILWTITLTAAIALMVMLAAVPAWAQNAVPPTAREAAALPEYAVKLHPATRPARGKPQASARARPGQASPQDGVIYDNGPVNGTADAWTINYGYVVSDTITGVYVTGFDFYTWEYPGDTMVSVDWSITSDPNGGFVYASGTASGSHLTDKFIFTNPYGYDIDKISATGLNVNLDSGQTFWMNLFNASDLFGGPVYWDENSGVGCRSSGCPSQAVESEVGTIASEAFDIIGQVGSVPCFKTGQNLQILHDFRGNGDGSHPSGVAADAAGNVYGAMSTRDTGVGMVYEIASKAGNWLFNILYSFTGGSDGAYPSLPIVGPEGALYGTAGGGNYGLVFSLRPGPTACLTALCSWTESVPYQFADGASAGGIVAFDAAGNLYGFSGSGGTYGQGAVFELTPSPGGWTETILYSFTGGSDGGSPNSLLVGQDGNLYGAAGVVFQLVRPPSGGNWTENVIYTFSGQRPDGGGPYSLVQDGGGNLLGISGYTVDNPPIQHIVVFLLSPSSGSWTFNVLVDQTVNVWRGQYWWSSDLASDTAGNVYWATGLYREGCQNCSSPDDWEDGGVSMRTPSGNWYTLWSIPNVPPGELFEPGGALAIDAKGNVYGTTGDCGKYDQGTVWKVTH